MIRYFAFTGKSPKFKKYKVTQVNNRKTKILMVYCSDEIFINIIIIIYPYPLHRT